MGLMTGMQRPSLSDEAVARLIDPRTGTRLRPLGVVGGRTVWPMLGASPDDPSDTGNGGGGADDDDNPEGGKSSDDSGKGGDDEGSKPKDNPDAKISALEEEKDRQYRRRKDAEAERDEMKKELEKLKGKDTPELEQLQNRVNEQETQINALTDTLRQARLENAFLQDNTYSWHNPSRALKLADLSDVEIEDDGSVHGLKAALDKLAKSDAYLINQESKGKGKSDDKKDLPDTSDSKNPSKKEKKDQSKEDRQKELKQKYGALRR